MRSSSIPELLAPAGGPAALRAAIANGADAVYLGVEVLNARRGAENFTLADLPEVCRYAHIRGVRIYLTVNVVVLPGEFDTALQLVDDAWAAGVDAVIVQDLGLLGVVRRVLPHVRVHASTQLNTHNSPTIETLAKLGVSRVTLAREVSIEEIATFAALGVAEVESFVHGALCMCYSGQCLMSSLIGRRSANRGLCAQPCRLPYELLDAEGRAVTTPGSHLLSPKDLAGIEQLPRLVASGVSALKIEGRMKSAEYVALVTGVYRAALDRAFADAGSFEVRDGERATLSESFSRGFSSAYLVGECGNEMMSYQRPNNRGVPVGRVSLAENGAVTIALDAALESADTIEFWTSAGRFAQPAGRMSFSGGSHDAAPAGSKVTIAVAEPVSAGDRVFRVRNAALTSAAARTFAEDDDVRPVDLAFDVTVVVGRPLTVTVSDLLGRTGSASASVVEPARTKSVTAEEIAEHVGRLGNTPFRIASWALELSPGAGIGFSALHKVRRDALAAYEAAVLAPWRTRRALSPRAPKLPAAARRRGAPALVVRVASVQTAEVCLEAGADRALVDAAALGPDDTADSRVVPVVGRICHDRELGKAMRHVRAGEPVVAGNIGVLAQGARGGALAEADWALNALNAHTVSALAGLGARLVWLSPELSGRQIAEVASHAAVPTGLSIYGRQELMVTEHCVLMAEGECDRRCSACQRRVGARVLRDRKGYEFPVVTDRYGRSHLYNSLPLDLSAALSEVLSAGVAAVRLDLELDDAEHAARHTRRFRELLERHALGVPAAERAKDGSTTSGHYFRGVL